MNRAIRRVGIGVMVLMLALVGQLTYLQVVDAKKLSDDPRNVRNSIRDFNRPRGEIQTADGQIVAKSVPRKGEFKFQREYPLGDLFGQISGYQSFTFGNTGIEKSKNNDLVGRKTSLQLDKLRRLSDLPNSLLKDATGNVVLSIDGKAQVAARDALGTHVGAVVAIDPKDGALLALWANPSYDPNLLAVHDPTQADARFTFLNAAPSKPLVSRAFRERFAPGSTFKTVTSAVGLDSGQITPDTSFPTLTQLDLPLSTSKLRNFGGERCGGTVTQSFIESCNTTFARIGLDLGRTGVFNPGMEKVGIGQRPPLDIDPGAVASAGPLDKTFKLDAPTFALAGIGQGEVSVTPLQMALVAAGIANGGVIMEPHSVAKITNTDDKTISTVKAKQWTTAMSPQTAEEVKQMMIQVVQRGTGTPAQIPGVTVAGKTGTAQVDNQPAPNAWFIAFAPAENPRVAIAVLVQNGGNGNSDATGGRVAAPIAKQVLQALLAMPPR
ncbi:MAG TPA: penicillin-binding protein 2 [Acidimicrobiia bacterium]|nr:penicillin-binding protein 2 [Acidimicrobiia bacterium]